MSTRFARKYAGLKEPVPGMNHFKQVIFIVYKALPFLLDVDRWKNIRLAIINLRYNKNWGGCASEKIPVS